jgi:hypothetical protein
MVPGAFLCFAFEIEAHFFCNEKEQASRPEPELEMGTATRAYGANLAQLWV